MTKHKRRNLNHMMFGGWIGRKAPIADHHITSLDHTGFYREELCEEPLVRSQKQLSSAFERPHKERRSWGNTKRTSKQVDGRLVFSG